MNKRLRIWLLFKLVLLLSLVCGCAIPVQPPSEPALAFLPDDHLSGRVFEDDMEVSALYRAIERSMRYYERLSPDQSFQYNELTYTPQEMAASLALVAFREERRPE